MKKLTRDRVAPIISASVSWLMCGRVNGNPAKGPFVLYPASQDRLKLSLQETAEITSEDQDALRTAVKTLEGPSLAGRLTNLVGKPIELIGYALPSVASKAIVSATSKGLEAALKVALRTLPSSAWTQSQILHRTLATASGQQAARLGWRRCRWNCLSRL